MAGVGSSRRSISVWFTPRERRPLHGRGDGSIPLRIIPCRDGTSFRREPDLLEPPPFIAFGVGSNDPDSFAEVRRSGMDSTHHKWPDGVARLFQRIVHAVISASSEARDVLKENPTGSHVTHQPQGVEEQSCPLAIDAAAFGVRRACVLAGRTSADDFGKESEIAAKSICAERSHIVIEQGARIVSAEDRAPPRIDLAGCNGEKSRAMQSERPSARGAAEQIQCAPSGGFGFDLHERDEIARVTYPQRRKRAETGGKDQASFSDSTPVASRWIGRTLTGCTR